MRRKNQFDQTIRIPVITDLVRSGDSRVIRKAKEKQQRTGEKNDDFERKLKARIAELQSATGQDEYKKLGRAHAIRSESSSQRQAPAKKPSESIDTEKTRDELIDELSAMLK